MKTNYSFAQMTIINIIIIIIIIIITARWLSWYTEHSIAITSYLSVSPSVQVSWSYGLKFVISLTFTLSADLNITDLLQREHPTF